jgi:hypothetical protein
MVQLRMRIKSFLTRASSSMQCNRLTTSGGGDFNLTRSSKEKNNTRFKDRWSSLFNAVINSLELRELELLGRQFTWANNLPTPTYEKLDRVLIST